MIATAAGSNLSVCCMPAPGNKKLQMSRTLASNATAVEQTVLLLRHHNTQCTPVAGVVPHHKSCYGRTGYACYLPTRGFENREKIQVLDLSSLSHLLMIGSLMRRLSFGVLPLHATSVACADSMLCKMNTTVVTTVV